MSNQPTINDKMDVSVIGQDNLHIFSKEIAADLRIVKTIVLKRLHNNSCIISTMLSKYNPILNTNKKKVIGIKLRAILP